MVFKLKDIIHLKKVKEEIGIKSNYEDIFTDKQKAKIKKIEDLLNQIRTPTTDEELDATITDLTEIRDKS
tara:strand:- start:420 stop:629 length:210 start_codon:yes stop_codon:yes gene_type:complete